jgi:hypothetical protein
LWEKITTCDGVQDQLVVALGRDRLKKYMENDEAKDITHSGCILSYLTDLISQHSEVANSVSFEEPNDRIEAVCELNVSTEADNESRETSDLNTNPLLFSNRKRRLKELQLRGENRALKKQIAEQNRRLAQIESESKYDKRRLSCAGKMFSALFFRERELFPPRQERNDSNAHIR